MRYDEVRSFVFVNDVVEIIIKCIISSLLPNIDSITLNNFECWNIPNISSLQTDRIFNVGGPVGLSRLDLAQILSNSKGVILNINNDNTNTNANSNDNDKVWNVFKQTNEECNISTGIISPKDVTMNVQLTEQIFNIKFKTMNEVINLCL